MLFKDKKQVAAEEKELKGATFYNFDDTVTVVGTGKYEHMPKDVKYDRVHVLAAKELVEKGYARIIADVN